MYFKPLNYFLLFCIISCHSLKLNSLKLFARKKLFAPILITFANFGLLNQNAYSINEFSFLSNQNTLIEKSIDNTNVITTAVTKLPSGVQFFDVKVGDGNQAEVGKTVQFQWVLRRSNGYFVDASSNYNDEPFIYKVGNTKKVIKGLDEGIIGMKVGGVRRITIPPQLAFVEGVGDDKPGPMPGHQLIIIYIIF